MGSLFSSDICNAVSIPGSKQVRKGEPLFSSRSRPPYISVRCCLHADHCDAPQTSAGVLYLRINTIFRIITINSLESSSIGCNRYAFEVLTMPFEADDIEENNYVDTDTVSHKLQSYLKSGERDSLNSFNSALTGKF